MQKTLQGILLLFLLAPIYSFGQGCYSIALQEGEKYYQQNNYAKAIDIWEKAKGCSDAKTSTAKINELKARIWKAKDDDGDKIVNGKDPYPKVAASTRNDGPAPTPPIMLLVKGGPFQMGDVIGDKEQTNESVHVVTVGNFWFAKNEITFKEYDAYCSATGNELPNDNGWGRGQRPVINVDWYDAIEYCNWRSSQEGLKVAYSINKSVKDPNNTNTNDTKRWQISLNENANGYRLPTEAEWEYAARAGGKKVRFGNGKDIAVPSEINFNPSPDSKKQYDMTGEYRQKTVPVGSLNSPNALQLHDLSGNVWEWCWDWYDSGNYGKSATSNPQGPSFGSHRVCRGGSWGDNSAHQRVSYRNFVMPSVRGFYLGFRLARQQ